MLILYIRRGCGFCEKVLRAGQELGLTFEIKEIDTPGVSPELLARGGKRQMPFLVDTEHGVSMYESDDIVDYLHRTFTAPT